MWKPPVNFITIHYAYIILFGILGIVILLPYGNLAAIDAYFMGVSASTESGLNTIDLKDLHTYQQFFLYITPMMTNLGFVNIGVIVVRLRWFRKRFKDVAKGHGSLKAKSEGTTTSSAQFPSAAEDEKAQSIEPSVTPDATAGNVTTVNDSTAPPASRISFAPDPFREDRKRVPAHNEGNDEDAIDDHSDDEDTIKPVAAESSRAGRRRKSDTLAMSRVISVERTVSSAFVLGRTTSGNLERTVTSEPPDLASLSREELGGIEYRALKTLLKLTAGYYFGLHLFGVICMVGWIHTADAKYQDYLASIKQDKTWWAFYTAQTMVDNLGLTLTPDSMISFRDATWPMLVFSFLAYAGNTFYPVFLRLVVWISYKLSKNGSARQETHRFLLDHPRRCYTLLFPSTTTWALATILFILNFIDILLIIVLDLNNPEVNVLPMGPRILAAIFQAASSRHTGTASFNLANVNPAVQFSLLVMMYISIYPIAISIRMSNAYEERALGIYEADETLDEGRGRKTYLINLMRNQLSFDLWYVFLGTFCVCIAESDRIMSREDYAFSVFSVFFEIVSAYGNVGLSLGHPSNLTSLAGHFTTFSKLVICLTMIRGRHRGLPYALDRAVTLPVDRLADQDLEGGEKESVREKRDLRSVGKKMRKAWTR
ncbi:potassium transporter [Sporormia fimetaria CBS 119925]|uniref:Potassium transporter n=1 Tax=Sporormia fimetaria CBS 119925 TaxID=1340428 RepID=A0A6A6V5C2_9PLEO|nr:potassium transporter [Sporormia fimetaria CBS 119925]